MHCVTVITPMKICFSYRCAVSQHRCTAALVLAKCSPHCSASAKQGHSMHCVTVITPMKICCSYRYALSQHQCTAALVLAKCSPHCSVLLCKTGSQHALCHCNSTYEDLLFIQVCSESAPMHCSTGFGKMQSPLFSVALQNRVTACTMSL